MRLRKMRLRKIISDCWCDIDDLAPCGELMEECQPGYKIPCICGEGCGYHIGPKNL